MMRNLHLDESECENLVGAFTTVISRVEQLWGDYAFQRWDGERWRKQALAGLYDAQMIACDQISKRDFQKLRQSKRQVCQRDPKKLFQDDTFEEARSAGNKYTITDDLPCSKYTR